MSWLFSQVLVEEYLGDICSDGEQSVQSNGNPIQLAYLSQDKMTKFSRLSQYGMMFKPLTEIPGEELSMSSVVAFHVRTLVQQGKVQELMESDQECGEKWRGSFTKYDPNSCSWKTHQCSLLGDLDEFSETWPQWGLMRDGECWEQQTLAQTIKGTEYGLSEKLPTPQSSDHITKKTSASWKAKGGVNFTLSNPEIQAKWPTPTVMDSITRSKESWEKAQYRPKQGKNLIKLGDIQYWPTPDANCGQRGTQPNWTPKRKSGHSAQYTINQAVRDLGQQNGGQLNPMWVEWLMGWPIGWTDLKPLETDKSHCVQQPHGEY